jgi:hypothetical protein
VLLYSLAVVGFIFLIYSAFANNYIGDIYFTVPDTVYVTNEQIEIVGYLKLANYSDNGTLISNSTLIPSASINLTIANTNGTFVNNYSFTTDSGGSFYSRSNYHSSSTQVSAPSSNGTYNIKAQYIDVNNQTWFSNVEISVVNQSIDELRVSPNKAVYNPSETVIVRAEAVKLIGDRILFVSNVSINGSLRDSSHSILSNFNCRTGTNGKCTTTLTAPSSYGSYVLELDNYKAFSSFSVVPFKFNVYMKDDLGKSLKNIYAHGESGRVEVSVSNASNSEVYTFSGYVVDSGGNVVKSIDTTILNSNNSFIGSFLFLVDSTTFSIGTYRAVVTVSKSGGGSISSSAPFEVKNWDISLSKKTSGSGFEYEYSAFPNKTVYFQAEPRYRDTGSIVSSLSSTFFNITLKDNLYNVIGSGSSTWNASCSKEGCYEISLTTPSNYGVYNIYLSLSLNGSTQTTSQPINVVSGVLSAQSTNENGDIKELFGTNEYAYLSLTSYNQTSSGFNLSEAEVFSVIYENGTEFSYSQANNWTSVNSSNSAYEWAWNSTLQRIKLDVPKFGGLYNVYVFGNNRTLGTTAKFIVNPYDVCSVPKNTPGTVSSGYYYVYQFKKTDTIYFEIKATQANNPLGKASAENIAGSSTLGRGSACSIDTTTKQAVTNATITLLEVKNMESGALQSFNSTSSTCQASDSSGAYSCTVQPLSRWDGGVNVVKFSMVGQDGTSDIFYSMFESRSFYLYGWSSSWQNSPSSDISLNVSLYEAGNSWWNSSSGLSGTISVKKIEYQGRDGEWIWPPVDSGYNVTNLSSASVTSGSGTISIPASLNSGGAWKTGYYRAVIQGTTSNGDTDYGYAWFGVKLWDVYGTPIECTSQKCDYKGYFNSRENITLYVKISQAGDYNYYYSGGQGIYGNVSISVKKIQDCRTWPCKELNSSQFIATSININASSPWYWNTNVVNYSNYIISINTTAGTWGTGYYSVVLDVNGTDTGYAWFNTIAFYVESQPTDSNGTNWMYSIRNNKPMYFNVTTTKSYKYGSYYYNSSGQWIYSRYNQSDYVNTTVVDGVLRSWDQTTWQQKEYNYPEQFNITVVNATGSNNNNVFCRGNCLINITYLNGSWPTGYYWGELTLNNSGGETSTGYLWFEAKPFRVQMSSSQYNIDSDQCINSTIDIYDPSWYSNTPLNGTYSIVSIYEDTWNGMSQTRTTYTNYTNSLFNSTKAITLCPNNADWGSGSWGGYHYLNIVVRDNSDNSTNNGWLSFRTVPFQISWNNGNGYLGAKNTNTNLNVKVSLTSPTSGANATGNLTSLYQWRCDNGCTKETYRFTVGNCDSNVAGQCTINATNNNITIYAPSSGWRVGYNYLQATWTKQDNAASVVEDYSGIYFDGRESYNGYFSNSDLNNNWKFSFTQNENITIKLYVRDTNYNPINVNITQVEYAHPADSCSGEWCRTYTSATFSPTSTSGGNAILSIKVPSTNWTKGYYYIRATVSGSSGSAVIKDESNGKVKIRDATELNISSFNSPINNVTYSNSTFLFNITTNKDSQCSLNIINYDNFYYWYCSGWNSTGNLTNSTNSSWGSPQKVQSCNITSYQYNGSVYYNEYLSNYYHSIYNGSESSYCSSYPGSPTYCYGSNINKTKTYLSSGGTSHTYTLNTTNWTAQHYGISVWCYDSDYYYDSEYVAFYAGNQSSNSGSGTSASDNTTYYNDTNGAQISYNQSSSGNKVVITYGSEKVEVTSTNSSFAYVNFSSARAGTSGFQKLTFAYDNDTSNSGVQLLLAHQTVTTGGRGLIHTIEGENAQINDWIIINQADTGTILNVDEISIDTALSGTVTFSDAITGSSSRETVTSSGGTYSKTGVSFYGGTGYNIYVNNNTNPNTVNITWSGNNLSSPKIRLNQSNWIAFGTLTDIMNEFNLSTNITGTSPTIIFIENNASTNRSILVYANSSGGNNPRVSIATPMYNLTARRVR